MLLYNFHGQVIDLSTFLILSSFNGEDLILNEYKNYHTYNDIKNYINGDPHYSNLTSKFEVISDFLNSPFFKIYSKVTDLNVFKVLFNEIVESSTYISAYKSSEEIRNSIDSKSIKSFLSYNKTFRDSSSDIMYKKYILNTEEYFNFRENYSTFRISNSFLNISNQEFYNRIYTQKANKKLLEFDVKASDWLWILYMNYLMTNNESVASKVAIYGVYEVIDLQNKTHKEEKVSILASMYSLHKDSIFNEMQEEIISKLDIGKFVSYILSANSVTLPNGFNRTAKYNIALYGQTLTSIFVMRFIFNEFKKYMDEVGGQIIFTKHDSIIFEVDDNFEFKKNFKPIIVGECINFCGKDYVFGEREEKILQIFLENNYRIKEIN